MRYQAQYQGRSDVKALMDTDDLAKAQACLKTQAPKGWIIDRETHPEKWIED